jgi:PKD repeat protein
LHLEPVVADAYVRGDSYADANFGDDDELIIKGAGSDFYTRRAYLQFDLTRFAASSADSAIFTVEVNYHQTPGVSVPLKLYSVASDSWNESTLTWNNEPGPGALLGTINVSDVGPVSFDLTSYVSAELTGDKTVSLVLLDDSGTNQMLRIRSRTVENAPPSLTLTAPTSECTPSGTTNNPPTAGFTFSTIGLDATFTDTSSDFDGTVTGWSWDFGDGNTSSDQTPPVHSYTAAGTYTVVLTASDDGGASDTASQAITVTALPDNEAPTMPPALWVDAVTTNRIDLLWSASTDNIGVTGYELFRDGSSLISVPGTGHSDSGLSPDESHAYQVRAFDEAGNNSALTTEVTGTTNSEAVDVITVIGASYKANRDEFKVRATSSDQPDVTLEVLGFEPMTFSKGKYEFKLRPVGDMVIPTTIDIESSGGGMITVPVVGAPEPPQPPAPPGQAGSPSPANGAIDVSVKANLGWSAGSQADTHNVYFGTTNPPSDSENQSGTSYDPGALAASTTYYWRVDEVNAVATTTGVAWNFTTGEAGSGDTVVITKAEWKANRSELKVEATSSGAPGAVLSLVGYNQMIYDSRKNIYKLTLRPEANPGMVTVSSDQDGSASKAVTVK